MISEEKTPTESPFSKQIDLLLKRRLEPIQRELRENGAAVLRAVQQAVTLMSSLQAMQGVYERRTQQLEDEMANLKERVSALEAERRNAT